LLVLYPRVLLDREADEEALEPKDIVTLDGGHFDAYVEKFEESSGPARDWFVEHLLEKE
jgi:uncharacterized protein